MTVQEMINELNKVPVDKRHLRCLSVDTHNGIVADIRVHGGRTFNRVTAQEAEENGDIEDMLGQEYLAFCI